MTLPWGLGVADGERWGGCWPWSRVGCRQGMLRQGGRSGRCSMSSDAVAPVVEAAPQRPRLGHKGRNHSIPPHGLEGGQPGLRTLPPSLGLRTVKQLRLVKAPFFFLASTEGPQSGLIGTEIRLFRSGQTRVDAARALREGDLDGHLSPSAAVVAAVAPASLPGSLTMAGKAQPHEVVEEQPAGIAPPGLGHQGPAGQPAVQGGRVVPMPAAAGPVSAADRPDAAWVPARPEAGGPGPWEAGLRGLVCAQPAAQVPAQEAAHAGLVAGRIFTLLWLLGDRGQQM